MSIENMMNSLRDGNPGSFKMAFADEMASRLNDRVDHYKDFVAKNFTDPEAEYPGYSTPEEAQDEVDTGETDDE